MSIKILPQPIPTNGAAPPPAQTTPFGKQPDGTVMYWSTLSQGNWYQPYLVQVEALEDTTLKFHFVSLADFSNVSASQTVDLRMGRLVWGDPTTTDSLPSTLKGAKPGQYAFLFLSNDGAVQLAATDKSGGTGKWPLSSYDTDSVILKYLPAIYKMVTDNSRLTEEELANMKALMELFAQNPAQAIK